MHVASRGDQSSCCMVVCDCSSILQPFRISEVLRLAGKMRKTPVMWSPSLAVPAPGSLALLPCEDEDKKSGQYQQSRSALQKSGMAAGYCCNHRLPYSMNSDHPVTQHA